MGKDFPYTIFKHKLQNYSSETAQYMKIQSMKWKVRNLT